MLKIGGQKHIVIFVEVIRTEIKTDLRYKITDKKIIIIINK